MTLVQGDEAEPDGGAKTGYAPLCARPRRAIPRSTRITWLALPAALMITSYGCGVVRSGMVLLVMMFHRENREEEEGTVSNYVIIMLIQE
jgi:hypothetical protein